MFALDGDLNLRIYEGSTRLCSCLAQRNASQMHWHTYLTEPGAVLYCEMDGLGWRQRGASGTLVYLQNSVPVEWCTDGLRPGIHRNRGSIPGRGARVLTYFPNSEKNKRRRMRSSLSVCLSVRPYVPLPNFFRFKRLMKSPCCLSVFPCGLCLSMETRRLVLPRTSHFFSPHRPDRLWGPFSPY
jgi:hypothetical protein